MTTNKELREDIRLLREMTGGTTGPKTGIVLRVCKAAERALDGWKSIDTMPKSDGDVFLVHRQTVNGRLVEQVEVYERQLYPSRLGDCIDWDDRIISATHWQPLPSAPEKGGG